MLEVVYLLSWSACYLRLTCYKSFKIILSYHSRFIENKAQTKLHLLLTNIILFEFYSS